MALLERVDTLIKANLNDLIDKAEDPEKLLKQLLLDMQNQYLQVKTQVAIAIADQHLLSTKHRQNLDLQKEWLRKAELAISKNEDTLARAAAERSLTFEAAARGFTQQMEDQAHAVQVLREALHRLEQKISETKSKTELLVLQHRRARLSLKDHVSPELLHDAAFDRARLKVAEAEALSAGNILNALPDSMSRLAEMEKSDQVDRLLAEIRGKALIAPQ